MKRALVTGATGFVGPHLISHLYAQGFEIWASYHHRKRYFPFHVRWIHSDITSFKKAQELIRISRPHYVFHLAAQSRTEESWRNSGKTMILNAVGSIYLLEAVLRFAPKARVLLVSSAQVYGASFFGKRRVKETDTANPISPYAGSKLLMEMIGLNYVQRSGADVVIARSFNQVGNGQSRSTVFFEFCDRIARMEGKAAPPLLKVGDLDILRDFLSVEDAVQAYYLLATHGKKGEIYNVGSGQAIHLRKALEFLRRQAKVPFKIQKDPSRFRKNDLPYAVADPSKLKRLGWRPRKSFQKALMELLQESRESVQA